VRYECSWNVGRGEGWASPIFSITERGGIADSEPSDEGLSLRDHFSGISDFSAISTGIGHSELQAGRRGFARA
jgi:hypothetical protein